MSTNLGAKGQADVSTLTTAMTTLRQITNTLQSQATTLQQQVTVVQSQMTYLYSRNIDELKLYSLITKKIVASFRQNSYPRSSRVVRLVTFHPYTSCQRSAIACHQSCLPWCDIVPLTLPHSGTV